jgi:hypothetical protein
MKPLEKYKEICERWGLNRIQASLMIGYTPEHIHRALSGKIPVGGRFAKAIYDWSNGELDIRRRKGQCPYCGAILRKKDLIFLNEEQKEE